MNFKEFYQNTERRLTDAILSLWATGNAETQHYLRHIFNQEDEKLLAEPVFQTTFPWEPASSQFRNLTNIFDANFINALHNVENKEYQFPKDRFPYKHQIESWDTLINHKKSIVVTTGTGSGKTECFMLPVLYDIYKNCNNSTGINAIFLYPLNALIGSQKKRIDAWTRSIGGVNYAVYNGNTSEDVRVDAQEKAKPEIISRKGIREKPPQILFTNPTMLEYILVRNKDVELLNNSKGKLRWILLDEAHTLTGSTATEMAMLIRRVLDAFEVDIKNVRFAATSATVGKDSDDDLKKFMSGLSGKLENDIKIIKGNRILPQIPNPTIENCTLQDIENSSIENRAKFKSVHKLRETIIKKEALSISEIAKPFQVEKLEEKLHLIDLLADAKVNDKAVFPVRAHFFSRGIGGVYVCTNPQCKKHGDAQPQSAVGTMSTIAGKKCNSCGFPLLELVACRSCGNYMLHGEKIRQNDGKEYFQLSSSVTQDAFYIESEESDDNQDEIISNSTDLFIAKYDINKRYINDVIKYSLTNDAEVVFEPVSGNFVFGEINGQQVCPYCGENTHNPMHFRISSSFLNRILSDIILEQTPEMKPVKPEMLWSGHKYISFTDSRQGTAKVSALINIDSERNWLRSQVFHLLAEKRKSAAISLSPSELIEKQKELTELENNLDTALDFMKNAIEERISKLKAEISSSSLPSILKSKMSWNDLFNKLKVQSDLKTLFCNSKRFQDKEECKLDKDYLKALFYDQFSRRLPRERSLENLGLVNIVYSDFDNLNLPQIAKDLTINEEEWNDLVKISADYVIRNGFHFFWDEDLKKYSSTLLAKFKNTPKISRPESSKYKSFPRFDKSKNRQNRLSLLICAGLGYTSNSEIDDTLEDNINKLLEEIWKTIRVKLLTQDGDDGDIDAGYKINIEEKFSFQLADKLWLCPVKNRLIDKHFKGYSPWITGNLTEENVRHFKIGEPIKFPYFPYPFNRDENGDFDFQKTTAWIRNECKHLQEMGVWNDLHERIIQIKPLFLAGEHSAQQTESRLQKLEEKFEDGKINILSCSTTMEMGVDIGGISIVVMNNVPPSPANYLQRAGRAGRRSETKSFALTFCASNPIGSNAMDNPMWALSHKIAPPMLSFNSNNVVERHINAFFLGKFVQTKKGEKGMNIKEKIEVFFFNENPIAMEFQSWLGEINIKDYKTSLKNLTDKTPLSDKPTNVLLDIVKSNFDKVLFKTQSKEEGYINSLKSLEKEFGENSPAYKSVNYQFNQFKNKHVIGYLAEERFIPSAGMPTGVVSFDTTSIEDLNHYEHLRSQEKKEAKLSKPNPSYHITRALMEYAPGNSIVIDGWSYKSAGIILKSEWSDAKRDIIQSCSNCGYQRILEISEQNQITDTCPQCKNNSLYGLRFNNLERLPRFTELIEPTGFAIDLFQPANRNVSQRSNSQYIEPLLIGVQPWVNDATSIYDIRESIENAEILYYNSGNGNGYSVCLHCGKTAFDSDSLNGHKRLRGGKTDNDNICSGNDNHGAGIKHNVILGGRFKTDFCEIRFRDENKHYTNEETSIWSLGVILTKTLTSYLGIEESELSFGVKRYDKYRSLFIFDNAAGGAGYSIKFSYYAEDIFKEALSKLTNCSCETACTKCLIDRSSQWFIQKLDRNKAIEWLKQAIKQTVPDEFKTEIPNLKSVLGTVREDIRRVNYRKDIKKIWFFVDNTVSKWDVENASFISDLKNTLLFSKSKQVNEKTINFVLNSQLDFSNNDSNRITAIQITSWAKFYLDKNTYKKLHPVCQIQLNDGSFVIYYSEQFDNSFNEKWGITDNGYIFKTDDKDYLKFEEIKINKALPRQNNHDIYLAPSSVFKSTELANLFIKETKNKVDLKQIMQNQSFDVVYSDRYLKSPFSNLLLIQFLKGLEKELGFTISSLNIKVQNFNQLQYPYKLYHNYNNSRDRDYELKLIANNDGFQNVTIQHGQLPHYRIFEFKTGNKKITIRPDGGIEHGWRVADVRAENYPRTGLNGSENISIRKGVNYDILFSVIIE